MWRFYSSASPDFIRIHQAIFPCIGFMVRVNPVKNQQGKKKAMEVQILNNKTNTVELRYVRVTENLFADPVTYLHVHGSFPDVDTVDALFQGAGIPVDAPDSRKPDIYVRDGNINKALKTLHLRVGEGPVFSPDEGRDYSHTAFRLRTLPPVQIDIHANRMALTVHGDALSVHVLWKAFVRFEPNSGVANTPLAVGQKSFSVSGWMEAHMAIECWEQKGYISAEAAHRLKQLLKQPAVPAAPALSGPAGG
ncbi:MAG: hypothetical protein M3O22_00675 [Pseudomonadota bacterium]|nr:hypothetical protein [Pseudomonadota bacterium]